MQGSEVIIMANHAPNQDADGVSAVWRAVHKLEKDFEKLVAKIPKPSAWSKAWSWFWQERNWTIPTVLAILAALGSGVYYIGGLVLDSHVQSALAPVQQSVGTINGDIREIKGTLSEIQLKQLSSKPADPQVTKEVRNVLATARSGQLQLSAEAITDAGERFVEASKTYPDAWNALQEILNYRTYQNSLTVNLGRQLPASEIVKTHYAIPKQNVPTLNGMRTIGASYVPDVAEIRALSAPSLNTSISAGPSVLVLDAPTVFLDGLYARKVVFENSHIIYRGGPVTLDNTYFLNCTFEIMYGPAGQNFADVILSPKAVTDFSAKAAS